MASITFDKVSFSYPDSKSGVKDITLEVPEGGLVCLVGASGCGKTTALKLAAGFLKPQSGDIALGGRRVAGGSWVPPEKRRVGLVFQQHALFPHMNVVDNILFGCNGSGQQMLQRLIADFRLEGQAKKFPHELSGGEQQRVALARALAAKPAALLLDEPFASIDSVLRRSIRSECATLLKSAGMTALMVTHDAEEAMELADRIYVMDDGHIVQSGTPREIYQSPASRQVAALFGAVNVISDMNALSKLQLARTNQKEIYVRPEALEVLPAEKMPEGLPAKVEKISFRGACFMARVSTESGMILLVHTHDASLKPGMEVRVKSLYS